MQSQTQNYQAWAISNEDFPKQAPLTEKIRFFCNYGGLAPSTHNTQPWKFEITADSLVIRFDESKLLAAADPLKRNLYISLGTCAQNIVEAARNFNFDVSVKVVDETIKLSFSPNPKVKSRLSRYIPQRFSYKKPFKSQSIPEATLREPEAVATELRGEVNIVSDDEIIRKISDIHAVAAREFTANPVFVRELADWLRSNSTQAEDGMPGFINGFSSIRSRMGPRLLKRKPTTFKNAAGHDVALLRSSPGLIVFAVSKDKPEDWIRIGMDIECMWLCAVSNGIAAHPLTAIVSHPKSATELKKILSLKGEPAFLMRIGYPSGEVMHTPRRNLQWN